MAEDASASDLESEGVEATLCAGCARNYEQRVENVGCSVCGLHMAAGLDVVRGIETMCASCAVLHVEREARGAVDAAVELAEAPLKARVAELEAAAPQAVPARLSPPSRFDGRMPAADRNGRELGEGSRGYYLPGVGGRQGELGTTQSAACGSGHLGTHSDGTHPRRRRGRISQRLLLLHGSSARYGASGEFGSTCSRTLRGRDRAAVLNAARRARDLRAAAGSVPRQYHAPGSSATCSPSPTARTSTTKPRRLTQSGCER